MDDDDGIAIKIVRLVKANEALGATIKCDTNGSVFIARIIAGGVADRSGCVQVIGNLVQISLYFEIIILVEQNFLVASTKFSLKIFILRKILRKKFRSSLKIF